MKPRETCGRHAPDCKSGSDVAAFHEIILDVADGEADLKGMLSRRFGHAQDAPVRSGDWDRLEADFARSLSSDLGSKHRTSLARRVFARLQHRPRPLTKGQLVDRVESVYTDIGLAPADLLIDFVHRTLATSRRLRASEVVFLARDAVPFIVIAHQLAKRGLERQPMSLLDLNRCMMPAFAASPSPSLHRPRPLPIERYLAAKFARRERVTIVDTGFYGTLIKATLGLRLLENPIVMFFASKNPNIFGYLNDLIEGKKGRSGFLGTFSETCCDTLEAWPKLYGTSELSVEADHVRAISRPTDLVSLAASLTLYRTLARRAASIDLGALDPHEAAHQLGRHLANEASAITLRRPLPRWKHAAAWRKSWDAGPIAPVGQHYGSG